MAKRRRKRKNRKLPILILLFIAAVTVTLTTPTFNIKNIVVTGNEQIESETITVLSGINKGTNIFTFGKGKAREGIKSNPYIDTVKIKRIIPSKVILQVTETKLAAYIKTGDQLVGIDKKGKALELFPDDIKRDKPIVAVKIKKPVLGETVESEQEKVIEIMTDYFEKTEEYGLFDKIDKIDLSSPTNIQIITKWGLKVKMGNTDETDYKLNYFKNILPEIGEKSGGVLDITNTERVPYRKSEK